MARLLRHEALEDALSGSPPRCQVGLHQERVWCSLWPAPPRAPRPPALQGHRYLDAKHLDRAEAGPLPTPAEQ